MEWLGAYSRFFLQAVIPAEPGSAVNVHEFRLNPLSDTEALAAGTKVKNNQMAWETAMAIKVPALAPGTEKTLATPFIPARASTIASRPLGGQWRQPVSSVDGLW